jgi:membrane-associated phospholipid phosphatase
MTLTVGRERPPWRRLFGVPLAVTFAFAVLMLLTAALTGLPLRDPEGFLGPSYVRLPLTVIGVMAADVLPRVLLQRPAPRNILQVTRKVFKERWTGHRMSVAAAGLASFYLAYVAYRNLKSFLPFLQEHLADPALVATDKWFAGGSNPADVLQQVLGTGITAEVLSFAYMIFLIFVPISLAVALVWSDDLSLGAWYVGALCFNWVIGTATYYAVPSLGPIYVQRSSFTDLPDTAVSSLQDSLYRNRLTVLADPHSTDSVHGIAAFASLHVSIVFTAALVAQLARMPRAVCWALWVYFALTALATVYFGWHYVIDVFAGLAVGGLSVWLAAASIGRARLRIGANSGRDGTLVVARSGTAALS